MTKPLSTSYQEIASEIFQTILRQENKGQKATYIPELEQIDKHKFGFYFQSIAEEGFGLGDFNERFSIQSIAKVISTALAYKHLGNNLWLRVGVEPSGTSFNSLLQLEADEGIPRNPLINAGALVVCDVLLSLFSNAQEEFLHFIRLIGGNPDIDYSTRIASSEKSVGYRNFALCYYLKSLGNIKNDPSEVLDFYFNLCSIELSCKELSKVFSFLANDGTPLHLNTPVLSQSYTKRINAIMQTCGFYDESGEFAFRVGLPGKSGVGGGVVAVMPNHYIVTLWSPLLNEKGNSYRGMKFLEEFTTKTHISIF